MKILDFNLPPFARTVFVSKEAKDIWSPKIELAAKAYRQLEIMSVVHGFRQCTTAHVNPNNIITQLNYFASMGLVYLPIRKVGAYTGFSHYHPPVKEGEQTYLFGVLARNIQDANTWKNANLNRDHQTMGELLGYPQCCREFFSNTWVQGYHDPIFQQAENCKSENIKNKKDDFIRLKSALSWESSSMLRYIGVRITPHIPCSHDCGATKKIAQSWIELGEQLNIEGLDELKNLLKMPTQWDANHGIANITTPVFKIETNSVTCEKKYTVQREGTFFPLESAKGLTFPFLR